MRLGGAIEVRKLGGTAEPAGFRGGWQFGGVGPHVCLGSSQGGGARVELARRGLGAMATKPAEVIT